MLNLRNPFAFTAAMAGALLSAAVAGAADKKYDPGASDTEIKIGQTVPHSGPGSLYGVLGRIGEAYFQQLNEQGGINGRKVKFITLDDSYSAPKAVEATRRLVEQEEVLALYGSLGTAPQTAVHKYLNSKQVPQLLLNTGAPSGTIPKNSSTPWRACRCIRPRRASWPNTSLARSPTPRSPSSIRTTISAATSSGRSRRCWKTRAARPRLWPKPAMI